MLAISSFSLFVGGSKCQKTLMNVGVVIIATRRMADTTRISSKEAAVMTIPDLLSQLNTNPESGLTSTDVELRQVTYGLNEMSIHEEEPILIRYIGQVSKCMIYLSECKYT